MRKYSLSAVMLVVVCLAMCVFVSCQKDNSIFIDTKEDLQLYEVIKNPIVQTEACLTDDAITLKLVEENDNTYYNSNPMIQIEWFKNEMLIKKGSRVDCVSDGMYTIKLIVQSDIVEIMQYEVQTRDTL